MTDSHLPASKRTIMVVDDDPDLVTILTIMLEQKEYNVRHAYGGMQLFSGLEGQKPDLIILDIMMPRMDGLEVLTRLKGDSNTRPIPVVLLTAKQPDEAIYRGGRSSSISVICAIHVIPASSPGGMRVPSPPLARCFGWKR